MANLLRELHRKRICPISLVNLLPEPFQDVGKKRNSLEKRSILIAAALSACQECDLNDARQPRGHAEWKTGSRKGMGLNCAILINVARSTATLLARDLSIAWKLSALIISPSNSNCMDRGRRGEGKGMFSTRWTGRIGERTGNGKRSDFREFRTRRRDKFVRLFWSC